MRSHREDDENQDDRGNRKQQLCDFGQEAVCPAAEIARDEAQRHTEDQHDREALDDREKASPAAVEDPAQDVAAQRVRAKQIVRCWAG